MILPKNNPALRWIMVDLLDPSSWSIVMSTFKRIALEYDEKCFKRRRVLDSLMLTVIILKMINSKSNQGYASIIGEFWLAARDLIPKLSVQNPVSQSSFSNARNKLDPQIFKDINAEIIGNCKDQKSYQCNGLRVLSVDGSKINIPRNLLNEEFKLSNPQSYYPQGLVSCLYDLRAKVPVDFMLNEKGDERACAREHLKILSNGDLVVYDRGYQSFGLIYNHTMSGVGLVMRMETTTTFNAVKEFSASNSVDRIVEIQPAEGSRGKIRKSCPEAEFVKLKIRLIKYKIDNNEYVLATSLLDKKKFPRKIFPDLYHSRWGVEEMYKTLKSSLATCEFHGKTRKKIEQELFSGFLMITIARLFANSNPPEQTPLHKEKAQKKTKNSA